MYLIHRSRWNFSLFSRASLDSFGSDEFPIPNEWRRLVACDDCRGSAIALHPIAIASLPSTAELFPHECDRFIQRDGQIFLHRNDLAETFAARATRHADFRRRPVVNDFREVRAT